MLKSLFSSHLQAFQIQPPACAFAGCALGGVPIRAAAPDPHANLTATDLSGGDHGDADSLLGREGAVSPGTGQGRQGVRQFTTVRREVLLVFDGLPD
jgi:hypothetical protein